MDDIAVSEDDVRYFLRLGFRADFKGLSPVVPDHAALNDGVSENIIGLSAPVHGFSDRFFDIPFIIAVKALYAYGIVKGTDKAMGNTHVFAVVHVYAV